MITREFKLYLNAGTNIAPVINANQFDQDEEWSFTLLTEEGTVYTPSTGAIIGLKTDGTTILNAGTVNSSGQVVITETEQMTAVPGSNVFELLIDGNSHGTANFVVFVEQRPGDIDNPSESDISLFQEAIDAAGNIEQFQADISALQSGLATTNANLTSEANTRQTQDAVLQAEIDQIIAPSGEAPSAAEVQNARIGVDGTTYDTLGNAVRGQVSDLKNHIDDFSMEHFNLYSGINNTLERYINQENGNLVFSGSSQASDYIDVSAYQNQKIKVSFSYSGAFYSASKTFISGSGFGRSDENYSDLELTVPSTAKYVRVSVINTKTDKLQIGKNITRYNYKPYKYYSLENLSVDFEQINGAEDLFVNNNLFNQSEITTGYYISGTTGNPNKRSGYNASGFIEIGETNYVTITHAWNAVIYKADKSYSREITRRYDNYPLTALLSSDERYIRLTILDANLSKAKVEINIGTSAYVDYGLSLDSAKQADNAYKQTKVYVGQGCYFTTINSALNAITDASPKNRYELFITEGEYNETITTKDYVDIVGESRYKSVINYISDDESQYVSRSAIFASTYTTIKNLTVKTTGSKYPLHCDARYNEPYEVICKNCTFKHDGFTGETQPAGTAVGIGLFWGQHVSLEQCECIGSGVNGVASVYCHNSSENDASHSRFRSLTIKNCKLSNATYGLRLQAIEKNQLQANECVYIGNKNTANTPVSVEANTYQSWHVFSIANEPSYTQE